MFKILIIEDDNSYREFLKAILTHEGYKTYQACNGKVGLKILDEQKISLIILDLMMPEMDGYSFLEEIRNSNVDIPVLIISAKDLPDDKKKAFKLGTDDYLTKPIDEEEMLLRIKAILRRAKIESEQKIVFKHTVIDYNSLSIITNHKSLKLPRKEFMLLYKLLSNLNIIFTKYQLLDELWGYENETDEATISVHINRLRTKLKDNEDFEIQTIYGIGYKAIKKDGEEEI